MTDKREGRQKFGVYKCEECGEVFFTKYGLCGHSGKHK